MKKIITSIVVLAVVGAGVWYFVGTQGGDAPADVSPSPSVSVSKTPVPTGSRTPTPSVTVTPTPTATPTPTPSPSTSPGVIFQESKIWDVRIEGFAFSPSPLTVKKGDVIVFKNFDSPTHTVTSLNLMFDSKNIRSGDSWTLETLTLAPGTYEYRCTAHPSMRGTIIVQ